EAQTGFQAGGPLLRNRLFLSSALERFRSRARGDTLLYALPTRTVLEFSATNSLARKLYDQFPSLIAPASGRRLNTLVEARPPSSVDRWLALKRGDWLSHNGAHRVFIRAAISRLERPDFFWNPEPAFWSPLGQDTGNIALGLQSTLRPSLTNEFRVARS